MKTLTVHTMSQHILHIANILTKKGFQFNECCDREHLLKRLRAPRCLSLRFCFWQRNSRRRQNYRGKGFRGEGRVECISI